jgi:hypothetical protein
MPEEQVEPSILVVLEGEGIALGFTDALRGRTFEENPFPFTREEFPRFDGWRKGWQAFHQQVIPDAVHAIIRKCPDEFRGDIEAHFRARGHLSIAHETFLHKQCVRP